MRSVLWQFGLPCLFLLLLCYGCQLSPGQPLCLNADNTFPFYWELSLQPPIVVDYGLGPAGVLNGSARPLGRLAKFGDRLEGELIYSYSDCDARGGGALAGSMQGKTINLTWEDAAQQGRQGSYRLTGKYSPDSGLISGSVEKDAKPYGTFKLQSSSSSPAGIIGTLNSGFPGSPESDLRPGECTAQAKSCGIPWNDRLSSPINLARSATCMSPELLRACCTQKEFGRLHQNTLKVLSSLSRSFQVTTDPKIKTEFADPEFARLYALESVDLNNELAQRFLEKGDGAPFLNAGARWLLALKRAGQQSSLDRAQEWINTAVYRVGFKSGVGEEFQPFFSQEILEGRQTWFPKKMPGCSFPYKYRVGQRVEYDSSMTISRTYLDGSRGSPEPADVVYRLNGLYYLGRTNCLKSDDYDQRGDWVFETQIRSVKEDTEL
jgi:hypothetical protein